MGRRHNLFLFLVVFACASGALVLCVPVHAGPQREWSRAWGSAQGEYGRAVAVDAAGNAYVGGYVYGSFGGQTNAGVPDQVLSKFDSFGARQWDRIIGSAGPDYGYGVAFGTGGCVYLAGSANAGFGGQTNAGFSDLCLTKFDPAGSSVWTRIWGSGAGDYGRAISADAGGGVYVAGYTAGAFGGATNAGGIDLCVSRLDAAGVRAWDRILGSSSGDYADGVAAAGTGGVYVVGYTYGAFGGATNAGGADLFLCRFATNGAPLWTRLWGSSAGDYGAHVALDDAGGVYVAGYTDGAFGGETNAGGSDLCLTKFDPAGVCQWQRVWGSAANETAEGVCADPYGNVYVGGFTAGAFGGQTNGGNVDFFLTRFDRDGNRAWSRVWGSLSNDLGYALCVDDTHSVWVAGDTEGVVDGQSNAGASELYLARWADRYLEVQNLAVTGVTETTASLRGAVIDTAGAEDPEVWVFWGPADGGTDPASWTNELWLGAHGLGGFSTNVSGLTSNTTYYYRCRASNSTGAAWAPDCAQFRTRPDTDADGMDDDWETAAFGGLARDGTGDFDGDGLTDLTEFQHALDPSDVDTDDDGYDDYCEQTHATDPDNAAAFPTNLVRAWSRIWGTAFGDYARAVAGESAGHVYVGGYSYGSPVGQTNAGAADFCVSKFDASGARQWDRLWGSADNDRVLGLALDAGRGRVLAAGYAAGGIDGQPHAGLYDLCVSVRDTNGASVWTRLWGTPANDCGTALASDAAGNIYAAGWSAGDLGGQPNNGLNDLCVAKWDADGTRVWSCLWGSTNSEYGQAVVLDAAGNLYVAGYTEGAFGAQTNAGGADLCLTKFDPAGNTLWTRLWGTAQGDYGGAAAVDTAGNVYVAGYTEGAFGAQTNAGGSDLCLSKFTGAGALEWTRLWGTPSNESAYALSVDESDHIFVTGFTCGTLDGAPCAGGSDLLLSRFDPAGNRVWTRVWGGPSNEVAEAVWSDGRHRICVAGRTEGAFDAQRNAGGSDLYVCRWAERFLDVRNLAPTNVAEQTATLCGELVDTGGAGDPSITLFWGPTDGGTNTAGWTNALPLGVRGLGAFSTNVAGLASNTTYYYRCVASNALRVAWALSSRGFRTRPDTDGDGMDDDWETAFFGDLTRDGTRDAENDGLTDLAEFLNGSDPTLFDTDGDAFDDFVEVQRGSDPGSADSIPTGLCRAWTRIWGSTGTDLARAIAVGRTNTIYVGGYSYAAFDGQPHAGSADLCLSAYDRRGRRMWSRLWGSTSGDYLYGIALERGSEAIYIAGNTGGTFGGQTNAGAADLCLVRVACSGATAWTRIWGSSANDYGRAAAVDGDGDIYVAGYTAGAFGTQTNAGGVDLCLHKRDAAGDLLWTQQAGSSAGDYGQALAVSGTGSVCVAGYTYGSFGGQPHAGGADLFLAKYDRLGTSLWTRIWGSTNDEYASGVAIDGAGNIYVAGYTAGAFDGQTNAGGADLCLTRYDSAGSSVWTRIWGSTNDEYATALLIDGPAIYVAGYTAGAFDGQTNAGRTDLLLTRFDGAGNRQWTRMWGGVLDDLAQGLAVDDRHGLYVAGYSEGGVDNKPTSGGFDLCLSRWAEQYFDVRNLAPTGVTASTAWLNGEVLDPGGAENPDVWIYWGPSDGGTNSAGWTNEIALGQRATGEFTTNVTGLVSNTVYYFRCRGTNSLASLWAPETVSFKTGPDSDSDGMADTWELGWFGNLYRDGTGDFDGDGLSDLLEYQNGSDPTVLDSDADGSDDYAEVAAGSNPTNAASLPATLSKAWTRIWGSAQPDHGRAVRGTAACDSFVAGHTDGCIDGQTNAGSTDMALTRFDVSGNRVWTRLWGSAAADYAWALSKNADSALYVGGSSRGAFEALTNAGLTDLCCQKVSVSGTRSGARLWGSAEHDYGEALFVDAFTNLYVAGYTEGAYDGQTNAGGTDLCLTRWAWPGTSAWTRIWGSAAGDRAAAVAGDATQTVYVAGFSYGAFGGQTNAGLADLCLSKFDAAGTRLWTRLWGSTNGDYATDAALDASGDVYVVGYAGGAYDGQSHAGASDLCLSKFDAGGTRLWTRLWGSAHEDYATAVRVDEFGDLYVAGYTEGAYDGQPHAGAFDLCLSKFDAGGTRLWTRIWGSSTNDVGWDVWSDGRHGVYVAGYTGGAFDGQTNAGGYDFCITRWRERFLDVRNLPATNATLDAAWLNGELLDTGGEDPVVTLWWGPADGGTNAGGWSNEVALGVLGVGMFTTNVSGLASNTTYYFRCQASNAAAVVWSLATRPFRTGPDSDGDGMADAWERAEFGTDAIDGTGDPDGDGLNDLGEFQNGTDPHLPDTDGDGYDDHAEFVAGTSPVNGGSVPTVLCRPWTRVWGSPAGESGRAVAADAATNVYVAGYGLAQIDGQTNAGGADLLLAKFDPLGTRQWTRLWGGAANDYAYGIDVNAAGDAYVAGTTSGAFDGQPHAGLRDMCLTRLNQAGSRLWVRTWGSSADDYARAVCGARLGSVYVAGYSFGAFGGQTNAGGSDLCLRKFNTAGTVQWTRMWGSVSNDYGRGVALDASSNVYVAGYTDGAFGGQTNAGASDLCLSKFDAAGSSLWTRVWGSAAGDYASSLVLDEAGAVYVAGYTDGAFGGQTNAGGSDLCLSKFDAAGSSLWTRVWGSAENDAAYAVAADAGGSVYVAGFAAGPFAGQTNEGGADLMLTRFGADGTRVWTRTWGSSSNDLAYGLCADRYHRLHVAGATDGAIDGRTNAAGTDLCLTQWRDRYLDVGNLVPDNVLNASAALRGELFDTGGVEAPQVRIYWGQANGATNESAWTDWVSLGTLDVTAFSTNMTGLSNSAVYYYRCWASNSAGIAWSFLDSEFHTGPDRDGDAMDDAWELQWFGTLGRTGTNDYDFDSYTDLQEFIADTVPTNPADFFVIDDAALLPAGGGWLVLTWASASGRVYSVLSATNLVAAWTNVYQTLGDGMPQSYTNDATNAVGFLKLEVECQ